MPKTHGKTSRPTSATKDAISAFIGRQYGIPQAASATARSTQRVEHIFDAQARALHCRRVTDGGDRSVGTTWKLDPAFGSGTYWYYAIDSTAALCSFSMQFSVEETVSCSTPPFFCMGAYTRSMTPYFGLEDGPARRTVLGYAWTAPRYTQLLSPGGALGATSILVLPEGIKRLAVSLGSAPEELERAICALDSTTPAPELATVLTEADAARPSARTAHAYYTAKIVEALALALDRAQAADDAKPAAGRALSTADRAAFARARQAIEDHLGESLANKTLCELAYMSESKLTRLFKQVEGTTPQGYARRLRMERARTLLETTDLPLAEVSRACGFARQGSFSEAFRERFGCTPRAYRTARSKQME